jgi:hypothetical protein
LFYTQLEKPLKNKAEIEAMIQEVKQWVDEIQILQKKLTEAAQEREEAFASAAKWRSLYETEAKQRRIEADLARQNANALKVEIQQLQEMPLMDFEGNCDTFSRSHTHKIQSAAQQTSQSQTSQSQADQSQADQSQADQSGDSVADLKAKLMQAWVDCDRLIQALKAEQAQHTQTRHALTTALGDTIEHLTQQRAAHHKDEQAEIQRQTVVITHETIQSLPKNPSLALPPTSLAQSRS